MPFAPAPGRMATTVGRWIVAGFARGCVALAVAGVTVSPSWAHAAPTAADYESARELWLEGKKLRDAGTLEPALEKFRAAWATAATPITGLELAKTLAMVGKLVEARHVALQSSALPPLPNESANATKAREEATSFATSLRERIPSIVPRLSGGDATLLLDDVEIPPAALGHARRVDPGAHLLRAVRADVEVARVTVTVVEGETREVVVEVSPAKSSPPPTETSPSPSPKSVPPPVQRPTSPARASLPLWAWTGLGVGAAGVVVGSVTGALAFSSMSDVRSACAGDGTCPPTEADALDRSRTWGTVSTIGFVVGGVGLAVFGVGYFTRANEPAKSAGSSVSIAIAPFGASVAGSF